MTTVQERLGDYEGLVEIARGGFATVYRAWQPAFEREVAIKVISGSLDQASFDRFQRECVAIGALSGHPNIVTVYDVDASDRRRPSIVMEILDGGSLAELVETKGPLDWAHALSIGIRLAGALESAHRASVLHLDVKPENVLLSRFGEPKLTDFGIARVQGTGDTGSGVVWATLAHAAPEVVSGSRPTAAADVYSLASTLHHLLSGQPPFVCPGDAGIVPLVVRIANGDPPDLRRLGVPDGLCRVLERAMAKDLGERPLSWRPSWAASFRRSRSVPGCRSRPCPWNWRIRLRGPRGRLRRTEDPGRPCRDGGPPAGFLAAVGRGSRRRPARCAWSPPRSGWSFPARGTAPCG